ncbi:hypothetical protein G3A39_39585 [Paraburkholderia aspalathi]|nr:hypothetical protein [Paraburkholderia aspalathi]
MKGQSKTTKDTPLYLLNAASVYPVVVALCPSPKAFKVLQKESDIDGETSFNPKESAARCEIFSDENGAAIIVSISRRKDMSRHAVYAVLIHEAVHVWQFICEHAGIVKPDYETEAYQIQAISGDLIKAYEMIFGGKYGS